MKYVKVTLYYSNGNVDTITLYNNFSMKGLIEHLIDNYTADRFEFIDDTIGEVISIVRRKEG